jgi:hypothetical protein
MNAPASRPQPDADDYRAADQVMSGWAWPPSAGSKRYERVRQSLAARRAELGADEFDLRYGLREPRSSSERLSFALYQGEISESEFRSRSQADAQRPIDTDMLRGFCDAYEYRLNLYGEMLQTIAEIATDERTSASWQHRESEIDRHVERLTGKLPLWREQLLTVHEFLSEMRASTGQGPVRLMDVSHATAHLLAEHVMKTATEAWHGCKEIALRSRTDPQYRYGASASALFYKTIMETLPRPNDLAALMQLERFAAMKALRVKQRHGDREYGEAIVDGNDDVAAARSDSAPAETMSTAKRAAHESAPAERAASVGKAPLAEERPEKHLSPSRIRARAVYEWAVEAIEGVDKLPLRDVYDRILEKLDAHIASTHPGAGELEKLAGFRDSLPPNAETFGRYLREAGVRRYNTKGERISKISHFKYRKGQ